METTGKLPLTDLAGRTFHHLSPAAAGLLATLLRPRAIAIACLVAIAGAGWIWLGILAARTPAAGGFLDLLAALCRPGASAGSWSADLPPAILMWSAMALAMMLPTAAPMILTYADIAESAAAKGEPIVSPFVLVAGYCAVWLGFAAAAASLQVLVIGALVPPDAPPAAAAWLAGAVFLAAGLYQFSALKQACLSACRQPFPFFFANWKTTARGVFGLGLRQGLHCLGCCWAMMLLMLAGGAMNALWMAALGAAMTIEKLTTTQRFSRAVGVVLVAAGIGFVLAGLVRL
jgi:predicted metal-binding membrane protein